MKLLVDAALSPRVADGLRHAGHDAVHARDRGLSSAPDEKIIDVCFKEDRSVISADSDFAMLLATRMATRPSFILLRPAPDTPEDQLAVLLRNLPRVEADLQEGSVVVFEPTRIRVRRLPIGAE